MGFSIGTNVSPQSYATTLNGLLDGIEQSAKSGDLNGINQALSQDSLKQFELSFTDIGQGGGDPIISDPGTFTSPAGYLMDNEMIGLGAQEPGKPEPPPKPKPEPEKSPFMEQVSVILQDPNFNVSGNLTSFSNAIPNTGIASGISGNFSQQEMEQLKGFESTVRNMADLNGQMQNLR